MYENEKQKIIVSYKGTIISRFLTEKSKCNLSFTVKQR